MKNKLNDGLGNWEKAAGQGKNRIYKETIYKQQNKRKKPFPFLTAATLLFFTVGAILLTSIFLVAKEPQKATDDPKGFRMFDERTVAITEYEMFYRGRHFSSKEAVEYFSLKETIEKYALFYFMARHHYGWDEERRHSARERVKMTMNYDMNEGGLKPYFDKMFKDLQITEEEYIDYYLLVNKEYEMLEYDLFNKHIGLEDGSYPEGNAMKEYQNEAGITEDDLNKLAERIPEPLEPLEPQPELPFDTAAIGLPVTVNEQGDLIFIESTSLSMYGSFAYYGLLYEIEQNTVREELNRHSFKRYQEVLRTYTSNDTQKIKTAKELDAALEILERTIEMEFDGK